MTFSLHNAEFESESRKSESSQFEPEYLRLEPKSESKNVDLTR